MMVHAFRKGIMSGSFSESLIRNRPKTFGEIRRRAVAHIVAEGEVNEKRTCVVPTRPRAPGRPQPLRVQEAMTGKRTPAKQQPYEPRKPQTRGCARENVPPKHNFLVELKDLIAIPNIAEILKMPAKTNKKFGPNKNAWCEFHQAFVHPIRNYLALEEWVPRGLLGRVAGSAKPDSARRRSGARDTRAWQNSHYFRGFLRRKVHHFSAKEVCTSGDVSRGTRGRLGPSRRPCLYQGRPPRCRPPRQ